MTGPRSDGINVTFEFCGVPLLLNNTGGGVWRLRSGSGGFRFDDAGAAQTLRRDLGEAPPGKPLPVSMTAAGGEFSVSAKDGSSVKIESGGLSFSDPDGRLIREIKSISEKGDGVFLTLAAYCGERFYGTGERFNRVDQRGKKVDIYAVDMWCRTRGNSYIPIPFLFSSRQNAVLLNRYERSVIDICRSKKDEILIEQKYCPLDLYVFTGPTASGVLRAYCELTGFAPMPPLWSFGTLVCRYHPEFGTKEGVFAMADAMRANAFPWDAVILEGFDPYREENFDELREIIDKIHSLGKKVLLYEQCGRFTNNSETLFGLDGSCAVRSGDGVFLEETGSFNPIDNLKKKKMRCVDLTNPRALEKWLGFRDRYIKMGVDGAKIDFCEQFPDSPDVRFHDGRGPMAAHHWYPTLYNSLSYRIFSEKPDGGIVFARGGGIGTQRFPFVWAGDQRREFFFLKAALKAALSLGLSGVPFVSWDMAGYQPSFDPRDRLREDRVFMRGIQMTAFSLNIQTHGRVKRPYDFDAHTKDVYRVYAELHNCLIPYLAEQAEAACRTGMPVIRHLFLYDAGDSRCLDAEDEYMLGCGLLAAPVLDRKNRRDVYLPKGEWTGLLSGRKYEGGRVIKNLRVPPEAIPVFVLEGNESAILETVLAKAEPILERIRRLCGE